MLSRRLQLMNLSVGISLVILFIISGQLMRHYYHNESLPDVERLYRRSRHLFLLLVGLYQGGIGIYIKAFSYKTLYQLQWLSTFVTTMAAIGLTYSFFYEIPSEIMKTPISRYSMYLLLASGSFHLIAYLRNSYLDSKGR